MTSTRKLVVTAAVTLTLGGCALLSTPAPEQLYRFASPPRPVASRMGEPASATAVRLGVDAVTFPREAAGVRILTTEGAAVSYLSGARWAAPAPALFENALIEAFADAGDVTLYRRGAGPAVRALLRVDVTTFEAAYDAGAEAAPLVTVRLNARMMRRSDLAVLAEDQITATRRADANTVGAVVAAYEGAVGEALSETRTLALTTARSGALDER